MKNILLSLLLLPAILFAQKSEVVKVIKLPIYKVTIPINEVWIDKVDSADKVTISFEDSNFEIEKFDLIIDNNGKVMRLGRAVNGANFGLAYYLSLATNPNMKIMIHLDHIYLKGNLRPANWTYRVRAR